MIYVSRLGPGGLPGQASVHLSPFMWGASCLMNPKGPVQSWPSLLTHQAEPGSWAPQGQEKEEQLHSYKISVTYLSPPMGVDLCPPSTFLALQYGRGVYPGTALWCRDPVFAPWPEIPVPGVATVLAL